MAFGVRSGRDHRASLQPLCDGSLTWNTSPISKLVLSLPAWECQHVTCMSSELVLMKLPVPHPLPPRCWTSGGPGGQHAVLLTSPDPTGCCGKSERGHDLGHCVSTEAGDTHCIHSLNASKRKPAHWAALVFLSVSLG